MHDERSEGLPIILQEIVDGYRKWAILIKRSVYKEEYL